MQTKTIELNVSSQEQFDNFTKSKTDDEILIEHELKVTFLEKIPLQGKLILETTNEAREKNTAYVATLVSALPAIVELFNSIAKEPEKYTTANACYSSKVFNPGLRRVKDFMHDLKSGKRMTKEDLAEILDIVTND